VQIAKHRQQQRLRQGTSRSKAANKLPLPPECRGLAMPEDTAEPGQSVPCVATAPWGYLIGLLYQSEP